MSTRRREIEFECADLSQTDAALTWCLTMIKKGLPAGPVVIRLGRLRRTLDQNAKLWPMLEDVASQVEWQGVRMSKEDWKDLFVGSLKLQRPLMGISVDGEPPGIVMIGGGSSRLNIRQFCNLIEFIYSFGSDNDVVWSEKSEESMEYARDKIDKDSA